MTLRWTLEQRYRKKNKLYDFTIYIYTYISIHILQEYNLLCKLIIRVKFECMLHVQEQHIDFCTTIVVLLLYDILTVKGDHSNRIQHSTDMH